MNKNRFRKTMGIVITVYFFVLGLIAACAMEGMLYHILGIAFLIAAGVVFIGTLLIDRDASFSHMSKAIVVGAASSALLIIGFIIVTKNVLFGLAFIFAGFIGCVFILPAVKGFKDDHED